ncbi:MAG: 2-oxoacid:acceptor oxidoreductase family protein [Limnochordaceae bacterium]|nr:2-oxoacid:acceptor oxidoreductase family protein [Limnochordaceae bacterium]
MEREILIAGFGGQGVMLAGILLAEAAMAEGYEVSWAPSYGPEMRGGTAHCSVVIADEPVSSPVVTRPDGLIVLNGPSLERFEESVVPGGVLVANASLLGRPPRRTDIRVLLVQATEWATAQGAPAVANMVALGALAAAMGLVQLSSLQQAVHHTVHARRRHLIPLNERALEEGFRLGSRLLAPQGEHSGPT